MTYQVNLAVFQGPFDLLLELISRRKVDVSEVDLADITGDFVASLSGLDELDLEDATHFLLVAATLIELKAARLLPDNERDEVEDALGELRDLLYARLLEYRAFRDLAAIIGQRLDANRGYLERTAPLEPRFRRVVPPTRLTVAPQTLAALAAGLLTRPEPRVDVSHIRREFMTVREAAQSVLVMLPDRGTRATFRELVSDRPRADRIVYFLALLELHKLGRLSLEQPDLRGDVLVERAGGGPDLSELRPVDEEQREHDHDGDHDDDREGEDEGAGSDPPSRPASTPAGQAGA